MSFFLKIIGALLLLDLLWWVIGARLLRRSRWRRSMRVAHHVFIAMQFAGLLIVILSRRSDIKIELPQIAIAAVYVWHLLIAPLLVPVNLLAGIASLLLFVSRQIRRKSADGDADVPAVGKELAMSRRNFFATAAALTPPLVSVSLTGIALRQLDDFRIRRITLPIAHLPPALNGMTIAHVSDMHVGRFTTGAVLHQMAAAVNELRADLVLLTGDMINSSLDELPEAIETVRRLEAAFGVYSIEGNHDLFDGREEFEQRVKASGLTLLVNENVEVPVRGHPVDLLGLRWGAPGVSGSRPRSSDSGIQASLEELVATRNPEAFPILLAHHPHAFDGAAAARLPLTLAGHTHGGQLMLNAETGFGPVMFRYWSGLYTRGESHLVVSNGVGNWFPLRTSAPAEIIQITLRRA